uniref:FAM86 N-terminal domain-containing protein n=1 Tax=Fagus sylvatica TaxID=28930 RepID=A0A2N9ECW3_FAGSY
MADQELDPSTPSFLHLVSAFLAMEPTNSLLALSRVCGGGSVTEGVQRFIWDHCLNRAAGKFHAPYLKNFLKKLIAEIELNHDDVLDELYERYAYYMTSLKDDNVVKGNARVCKYISFLFPDGSARLPSCPNSRKLVVPLQCSLNMLEGDTGNCGEGLRYVVRISSTDFRNSMEELRYKFDRLVLKVGSGVGLVGICLAHVEASKVILSDGGLSTLMNMKLNLELNNFSIETDRQERTSEDSNTYASHILFDLLSILLNKKIPSSAKRNDNFQDSWLDSKHKDGKVNGSHHGNANATANGNGFDASGGKIICNGTSNPGSSKGPMAYIAFVIRNIDTFNQFLSLVDQANITITDLTETHKALNLLPYIQSYDRSNVRLFVLSCD